MERWPWSVHRHRGARAQVQQGIMRSSLRCEILISLSSLQETGKCCESYGKKGESYGNFP